MVGQLARVEKCTSRDQLLRRHKIPGIVDAIDRKKIAIFAYRRRVATLASDSLVDLEDGRERGPRRKPRRESAIWIWRTEALLFEQPDQARTLCPGRPRRRVLGYCDLAVTFRGKNPPASSR